ncbi:acetyl-CoA C-acetyltransferase [Desulfopila aestuarii]|uniref:Acetyl-CoA C-acetyltransferase n=1 Tax=Desulfopila aestuarii DSM 18488 TaxID=1121416 RepID=A0A1M7XVH6_9BACT|nr:acetyl-CoA C-acetyltransferase [Desulfopila aestuarii]SHO42596.1 acetyl-CoA C-acetyltransferase [Desulfopila aestuarii DSM 18488]
MRDVVIVSGKRTAIGAYGGTLKDTPLVDLGAAVLKETLRSAGLRPVTSEECSKFAAEAIRDEGRIALEEQYNDFDQTLQPIEVDQVIMGNVLAAGQGQNTGRQAMIRAGIPKETSATTVNKLCASGIEAVALATQAIRCGDSEVILAGGMESMSRVPYALPNARWGQRMGDGQMVDLMVYDGLYEIFNGYHMGMTAENIAARYGITRQEQDELGALSHQRAMAAIAGGAFTDEIVPVAIPQRKGDPLLFQVDERPMETSTEKMARLRPAFKKDGTVTAGNASGLNDAAAALLIMSAEKAAQLGLKPLVKIKAHSTAGLDPAYMGLGPIPAVRKLMAKHKLTISDFAGIELNEAFAVQAIACMRELGCDIEKTNVLGSGISLGHPIGCTGTRILVTLMQRMKREDLSLGLASLCIGGGQGMAMVLENC